MIAVGREPKRCKHFECGTWFMLRPANSSREYSVVAEERLSVDNDINHVAFVTNEHTLTQFKKLPELDDKGRITSVTKSKNTANAKAKTIVFKTSGVIVP